MFDMEMDESNKYQLMKNNLPRIYDRYGLKFQHDGEWAQLLQTNMVTRTALEVCYRSASRMQ